MHQGRETGLISLKTAPETNSDLCTAMNAVQRICIRVASFCCTLFRILIITHQSIYKLCTFTYRLPLSIDETAPYIKERRQSRLEMARLLTTLIASAIIKLWSFFFNYIYKPFLYCIQTDFLESMS